MTNLGTAVTAQARLERRGIEVRHTELVKVNRQGACVFEAELPAKLQAVGGGRNAQFGHGLEMRNLKFEISNSTIEFRVSRFESGDV